jgi:hypothetical protein
MNVSFFSYGTRLPVLFSQTMYSTVISLRCYGGAPAVTEEDDE